MDGWTETMNATITSRGSTITLRRARAEDVGGIVALHRRLVGESPPPDKIQSPDAWFGLGGPWMDEYYCGRHIRTYKELGWDCSVLVGDGGEIVGSVEVLYTQEPEPFGRYGHLEMLEADPLAADVEHWVLEQCEAQARNRGYHRFWCRPVGSGGSPLILQERGYEERWRSAWLTIHNLDTIQTAEAEVSNLRGIYGDEASSLLALNHREAAEYRWGYLWRAVLTPQASDYPAGVNFKGVKLTARTGLPAACLVSIRNRRDPQSAWVDLWIDPEATREGEQLMELVDTAAVQAASMGATSIELVLPDFLAGQFQEKYDAEFQPLEAGDPWLLKGLE
jgi:hypothetical protein